MAGFAVLWWVSCSVADLRGVWVQKRLGIRPTPIPSRLVLPSMLEFEVIFQIICVQMEEPKHILRR